LREYVENRDRLLAEGIAKSDVSEKTLMIDMVDQLASVIARKLQL